MEFRRLFPYDQAASCPALLLFELFASLQRPSESRASFAACVASNHTAKRYCGQCRRKLSGLESSLRKWNSGGSDDPKMEERANTVDESFKISRTTQQRERPVRLMVLTEGLTLKLSKSYCETVCDFFDLLKGRWNILHVARAA